jgi:hypothetical protein
MSDHHRAFCFVCVVLPFFYVGINVVRSTLIESLFCSGRPRHHLYPRTCPFAHTNRSRQLLLPCACPERVSGRCDERRGHVERQAGLEQTVDVDRYVIQTIYSLLCSIVRSPSWCALFWSSLFLLFCVAPPQRYGRHGQVRNPDNIFSALFYRAIAIVVCSVLSCDRHRGVLCSGRLCSCCFA